MKKIVPQYLEDGLWKDMDFNSGEIFNNPVPTDWIFENYAKTSLYYSFNIGNKHQHAHDFSSVLKMCFDYPDSFNLNNEDKNYYTKDQLEFLDKLQNQSISDELHDIMVNNKFIITELEKRNYQTILKNIKEDNY
ncbi:MAG: hypothetical protein IJN03_00400 [Bacilli bacterium]|nr:hypothetical protein [Bacilli bacterium]